MASLTQTRVFNRTDRLVEGWYWALASHELAKGKVRRLKLLGRELVLWRDSAGAVHANDAYCPHMGAHFAEGKVKGDRLQCFFHGWEYDAGGRLVHIPCEPNTPPVRVNVWPAEEVYGMIWVWAGPKVRHPLPFIPELQGKPVVTSLGNRFVKGCHPNVVMINAIDEQHFATVHRLFVDLHFDVTALHENAATWDNTTPMPKSNAILRWAGRFYKGPLTYRMTYWNGTTGSVTVGPDFWHFHILFALRPNDDGHAEGQTILISPRAPGLLGRAWNEVALRASQVVGDYFAKGDTEVFQSIRWNFQQPIKADRSILHFVRHLEQQPTVAWGTWEPIEDAPERATGASL
jgi:phenylpropionate dioxygenase-like ring-hydroxylating dioxygenase large terminal subunit